MEVELEKWPPSVNHMYTIVRGRKILTPEGRAYKVYVHFAIAQAMPGKMDRTTPYKVSYLLFREDWINKGWPSTKERFKKLDLSNAIKCLEDAISESLGIDDSQFVSIEVKKCIGTQKIRVKVEEDLGHPLAKRNSSKPAEPLGWEEIEHAR